MCEKCEAIDKRIGHYREMGTHLTDTQTLEGIGILIAKLEADKKALHPEQQSNTGELQRVVCEKRGH